MTSEKMNVRRGSKPQAMMSLAFSRAKRRASSRGMDFHRNFSSSVSWMTSGTLNARCSQRVKWKGMRWPRWRASLEGPRPV